MATGVEDRDADQKHAPLPDLDTTPAGILSDPRSERTAAGNASDPRGDDGLAANQDELQNAEQNGGLYNSDGDQSKGSNRDSPSRLRAAEESPKATSGKDSIPYNADGDKAQGRFGRARSSIQNGRAR